MEVPHSRCNFISEERNIIVGAIPIEETLQSILDCNVRLFINLSDREDALWYQPLLPEGVDVIHIPTKGGSPPEIRATLRAFQQMQQLAEGKIYIHCNGGHGRAGTFAALWIGKKNGWNANEAIHHIEQWRLTRPDQSKSYIPTPETQKQVNFLVKHLGLGLANDKETVPDRSDRTWLQRVKKLSS